MGVRMTQELAKPPGLLGKAIALGGAALSGIWLLNFTFGIFEIPDNLPLVGNIDEAIAAWVLFTALEYLGLPVIPSWASKFKRRS